MVATSANWTSSGSEVEMPFWIDGRIVEPLRLEEDLVAVALAEADDLILDRGAVARAAARNLPEYIGERWTLARMTSWVAALVRVMPHWTGAG
jgi:hypothetical protein